MAYHCGKARRPAFLLSSPPPARVTAEPHGPAASPALQASAWSCAALSRTTPSSIVGQQNWPVFQTLGCEDHVRCHPRQKLHPVGALRAEHVDHAGERIRAHRVAHQRGQSLRALAEVDRLCGHHHPHRAGRPDLRQPSAPGSPPRSEPRSRPARCGPWRLRSQLRCCDSRVAHAARSPSRQTPTLAGPHSAQPARTAVWSGRRPHSLPSQTPPREQLRGVSPCRRATALIEVPGPSLSATMAAFSSSDHVRRRPAPVNSSMRRTGSDIAIRPEIDM